MALTIADVEDARMRAREKVRGFRDDFNARFYRPLRETMLASMWRGMDPAVKAQLHNLTPDAARVMNERYGGDDGSTI